MKNLTTIVLATRNKGKTFEIKALLKGFPVIIKNLADFSPIPQVAEDGITFAENAYKKAKFAAKTLKLPAMADDSGLIVEALGGAPGIHSARYAGENATDEENRDRLLTEMTGKINRKAAFKCVISIAVPSGCALTFEASCEGIITEKPVGSSGFGYDPVFYYPPLKKTFAQVTMEQKSQVSHRGKALNKLLQEFDKSLSWIKKNMSAPKN